MFALNGTGIGRSVAVGRAVLLDRNNQEIPKYIVPTDEIQSEIKRFHAAVERTRNKLRRMQRGIPESAPKETNAFIEVHLLMLRDPLIAEQPVDIIRNHSYNAEWALKIQADVLAQFFQNIEDPYLRNKKNDVRQIADYLLDELMENDGPSNGLSNSLAHQIVVAKDLTPSDAVTLHHRGINAFVTSLGGPISHTAILVRSLGIPAVIGLHDSIHSIEDGELLAIDGHTGTVLVDPDPKIVEEFRRRQNQEKERQQSLATLRNQSAVTLDGCEIDLVANIELPTDVYTLERFGCRGVGLYRTEFLFMNRNTPPDELEQYQTYRKIVETLNGPVTIRTLDLGADKQVDGGRIDSANTINPALGLRAIRLCLSEPKLFKPHLRAILRASAHGQARIMIPMLSSIAELDQTLEILREVKQELSLEGVRFDNNIPVGGMIEVPAAAISADIFASKLDFLSIGTNDLIQYTLAIDRIDDEVNYLYDPLHPSVLRLINHILRAGQKARIPVSMCGEMAGNPDYTPLLLGLGLLEFSMEPSRLLEIKQLIRSSDRNKLISQVNQILESSESDHLRMMVETLQVR